jgi:hypothetical protein
LRLLTSKVSFSILVCFFTGVLSETGSIPFLCSRINSAWSYANDGWFIDSSGAIRNYSFALNDRIGYVRETDTLPSKMYNAFLVHSTPSERTVPRDTLLSKVALIESAGSGVGNNDERRQIGDESYRHFTKQVSDSKFS